MTNGSSGSPILQVPDEGDDAVRLENTSEFGASLVVVGAPVECLIVQNSVNRSSAVDCVVG